MFELNLNDSLKINPIDATIIWKKIKKLKKLRWMFDPREKVQTAVSPTSPWLALMIIFPPVA